MKPINDETPQARMCTYLFATSIFRSRDHDCPQSAQVRGEFSGLTFDRGTCTDYWGTFYGLSSGASFCHCIWEKQQSMSSFTFTHCNVAERVLIERIHVIRWRPTPLPTKLYSNTNVPINNRWAIHEELQELGVSPQQLDKYLTSFMFRLLKLLFWT